MCLAVSLSCAAGPLLHPQSTNRELTTTRGAVVPGMALDDDTGAKLTSTDNLPTDAKYDSFGHRPHNLVRLLNNRVSEA